MNEYKFLVNEYLNEYRDWLNIRGVTYYIHEMKNTGNSVIESRVKSFEKKLWLSFWKRQSNKKSMSSLIKV